MLAVEFCYSETRACSSPPQVKLLARTLNVAASDIIDFELQLTDTQPAAIGGLHDEFVLSGRLDNQCSCYLATEALIRSLATVDAAWTV